MLYQRSHCVAEAECRELIQQQIEWLMAEPSTSSMQPVAGHHQFYQFLETTILSLTGMLAVMCMYDTPSQQHNGHERNGSSGFKLQRRKL